MKANIQVQFQSVGHWHIVKCSTENRGFPEMGQLSVSPVREKVFAPSFSPC